MLKWRFIAGARCPACGKEDTVRLGIGNGQFVRDCVDCGFTQTQAQAQSGEQMLQDVDTAPLRIVEADG